MEAPNRLRGVTSVTWDRDWLPKFVPLEITPSRRIPWHIDPAMIVGRELVISGVISSGVRSPP